MYKKDFPREPSDTVAGYLCTLADGYFSAYLCVACMKEKVEKIKNEEE